LKEKPYKGGENKQKKEKNKKKKKKKKKKGKVDRNLLIHSHYQIQILWKQPKSRSQL